MEMFVDSMNGEAYDAEKYSKFYKPWGLDDTDEGEAKSATAGSGTHATYSKASGPTEDQIIDTDEGHTEREEALAEEIPVARPAVRTATATTASAGTGQKQSVQDLLQTLKNKKK